MMKDGGSIHLLNKFKQLKLTLQYIVNRYSHHSIFIQLFCDYWIMNKTGDPLM